MAPGWDNMTKLSNPLDEVVTNLLHGLLTDGAHHKQYYLDIPKTEVTGE